MNALDRFMLRVAFAITCGMASGVIGFFLAGADWAPWLAIYSMSVFVFLTREKKNA